MTNKQIIDRLESILELIDEICSDQDGNPVDYDPGDLVYQIEELLSSLIGDIQDGKK